MRKRDRERNENTYQKIKYMFLDLIELPYRILSELRIIDLL